jgi:carbamoyl-phosphate synthase small subunit
LIGAYIFLRQIKDFPMTGEVSTHPLDQHTHPTGVLVLADGTVFYGHGLGANTQAVGELCFNTAITGYQEIISDPSYAGQIVTFTFPHIGNVGTNPEDLEADTVYAKGFVVQADITAPSNWRASDHLNRWAEKRGLVGISGLDTRELTRLIREKGMPHAVIAHNPQGIFDIPDLVNKAKAWSGLEGLDLAATVTCKTPYTWTETLWTAEGGFGQLKDPQAHIVAIDFGIKKNILRCLATQGCSVTVVPASTSFEEIMTLQPDGLFLSNGPGDPAATGAYVVPVIQEWLKTGKPLFGICLGHQMLALALGARTSKMKFGHHGANHPVKNKDTDMVEITSMNHGFTVERETLGTDVEETHYSLFDGSNCGLRLKGRPVFSVQYHPEASPGPQDSYYLFKNFAQAVKPPQQNAV